MLHVVREFAMEQLALSNEREQLMARLTQWCIDLIVSSAPQLLTDAVDDALDRIEMAHADIREVLRHAMERNDLVTAWRVLGRNSGFWFYRGYMSEAMEWLRLTGTRRLREVVVATEEVPADVQAEAAVGAGVVCFYAAEYASSVAYLDRAVELCLPLGDDASIAMARLFSGLSRMSMGDPRGGEDMSDSITMARRSGHRFALCLALAFITEHHARHGDAGAAMSGLAEAEHLAREPLNRVLLAMVLMVKGNLAMCEERFSDAIMAYEECIRLHNSTRVFGPMGWAQNGMAYAYMRVGQPERAHQVFGESLETGRICGNRAMALSNWVGFAALAAEAGDLHRAARLMGAADSMQRKTRYVPWTSNQGLFALAQRTVTEKLPPEELAAERSKGERLQPEEVSAMALGRR